MARKNYRDYSLSFGEDVVAGELASALNGETKKQYSIYAPLSRQEKGIDLLIRNNKNGKTTSIQVKESRIWSNEQGQIGTFFNVFAIDENQRADFYALIAMYPFYKGEKPMQFNAVQYKPLIQIYTYEEMKEELGKLTTKKGTKEGKFSHQFKEEDDIVLSRGYVKGVNTLNNGSNERAKYLLKNRTKDLVNSME
jgi:hypothetical protein